MTTYASHLAEERFAIFLFHGVVRSSRHCIRNYTRKHIALDDFVSVLRDLCSHGIPISMADIVHASATRRALPRRAFAITFDDGFENNYSIAAPVLRELEVPATFYVTSDFVDSNRLSWVDLIEYAVERTPVCQLALSSFGIAGVYRTRDQKIQLLESIRRVVKGSAEIDPYEVARVVCEELGVDRIEPDPELDQKMTWDQVRELSRERLCTVGGHGHTHRVLAYLSAADLQSEVTTSMEKLRRCLEGPVEHYSYPEGLPHCYSDDVIDVLRRHGVVCAPTAEHGTNQVGDDLFRLKRIAVT